MPAGWRFVDHAFLHRVDVDPGRIGWPCQANVFAAIGEACEPLVRDTGALVQAIGTGVAEAAVVHIPAVQARAPGQGGIPDKWIETAHGPVMVDQVKQLLCQL